MPIIIGFLGKKGYGKNTCADILTDHLKNYKVIQLAFANPLKESLKSLFGFNDDQLYGNSKEKYDEYWKTTPREIMQYIGTDIIRNNLTKLLPHINNNFWIMRMKLEIDKYNDYDYILINDVRFQNETDLIQSLEGFVIKIVRDNLSLSTHESETSIDNIINYNFIIYNNENQLVLKNKLLEIFNIINKKY